MLRSVFLIFVAGLIVATNGDAVAYVSGPWKLTIINNDNGFAQDTRQRIVDTFFHAYPQIQPRFNAGARKDVQLTIDPGYNGVAYAANGAIVVSAQWLRSNPKDTDLVTHELMHVVQSYPGGQPGWLVEGIADYVRWRYGRDNNGANWALPNYSSNQRYTDSYRVTGRFLAWLERKVNGNIVNRMDTALRQNRYQNGAIWNQLAGKSVDQLWDEYSRNPAL